MTEEEQRLITLIGEERGVRALEAFEERLGYVFTNRSLLVKALTHRSFANERSVRGDNQRLEYLGDAVLDLVISTELFNRYPTLPEGKLSFLRSQLVREGALAKQARQIALGSCLLLGKGEAQSGGEEKASVLADAYEALLASIYKDGGFERVYEFIVRQFETHLVNALDDGQGGDYKTRLQEMVQATRDERPCYVITSVEGPPHERVYTATVSAGEAVLGEGSGCSKKSAQQDAAKAALTTLERCEGEI